MARNRSVSPLGDSQNGSPQPQALPLSKREKRRMMLSDRLNDMVASFTTNLRPHYDAQINAIQVDINLIMRADPYANRPLDDSGEEIADLISSTLGGKIPSDPIAETDFTNKAGRAYSRFVNEVNDALEERDADLTLLANKYQAGITEIEQLHQFKVRLAHEEHRLLANSIRERLIQQVSQKRAKLLREKEQLDIGDSNAMLLHPNQFSIANPASPGGPHNPRKTRHTRHLRDPDELASAVHTNEKKRKRLFEEVEDSPGPASRNIELGMGSPFRDAKAKLVHHQYEAPAYSVDRLFTEKELQLATNTAAVAATDFLLKLKNADPAQQNGITNGLNGGAHSENEAAGNSGAGLTAHEADDEDATPAAPEMDRTISHHATRGATRNALTDLAAVADRSLPISMPVYMPVPTNNKANATAPPPPQISLAEADQDLALMLRPTTEDDTLNDKLLEQACMPEVRREFQFRSVNPNINGVGSPAEGPVADVMQSMTGLLGGVPMSAQSSVGGHGSDAGFGGVAMSRNGSARGAAPMVRTASGAGRAFLGVADVGRRVK